MFFLLYDYSEQLLSYPLSVKMCFVPAHFLKNMSILLAKRILSEDQKLAYAYERNIEMKRLIAAIYMGI